MWSSCFYQDILDFERELGEGNNYCLNCRIRFDGDSCPGCGSGFFQKDEPPKLDDDSSQKVWYTSKIDSD